MKMKTKVVDQLGNFRIIENGFGGYKVQKRNSNSYLWYDCGNEHSFYQDAQIKMSRLMGHRDTHKDLKEWWDFYGCK